MKTLDVDFNALTDKDHISLGALGSRRSLSEHMVGSGEWVWLTDGEMGVGARVESDETGRSVAIPAWDTLVHLDPNPDTTATAVSALRFQTRIVLRDGKDYGQ